MKRLLTILIAVAGFLSGATKLNLGDVRGLPNAPTVPYLLAFTPSGWIPVIADPGGSIALDTSGAVAVLRAPGSSAVQPVDVVDEFTFTSSAVFTTTAAPRGIVHVYRNGSLMRATADYTPSGGSGAPLSIGLANASAGDYVTLAYQK